MYNDFFKPLFERLFAFLLLIILSPVIGLTALVVTLGLGRPVFFVQKRPGLHGKIFTIYKFRTMNDRKDEKGELLADEERLTTTGRTIRSLSLDELPQLWNVLKGDMSFIGPRPLLVEYLPLYNNTQKRRHDIKPGITGWAQVNGRNAISWQEKFELDLYYVEHRSFILDMKIILMTLKKVLVKEGISADQHVTTEKFNGHN
jgi:lipopolysaccharide/colanic/teichoic acid biosynthesis glycosyltransferase